MANDESGRVSPSILGRALGPRPYVVAIAAVVMLGVVLILGNLISSSQDS